MSAITPDWNIEPFAKRVPIAAGDKGTVETLNLEGSLAGGALMDPLFPVFFRRKILAETGIDPRDVMGVFGRIFDYVKANVGYQPDPLVLDPRDGSPASVYDYVQSPHWTFFIEGFGDCLAHAGACGSVAMALGHGFAFKTLRADPADPSRFSHVYAMLGFPTKAGDLWVPCDTTVPDGAIGAELPDLERYSPAVFIVAPAS